MLPLIMPKSWLSALILATFVTSAAAQDVPAPQELRNLGAVQCKLSEFGLNFVSASWAATLDIAQEEEIQIKRLNAEIAKVKAESAEMKERSDEAVSQN
jgi:hypothetical protein